MPAQAKPWKVKIIKGRIFWRQDGVVEEFSCVTLLKSRELRVSSNLTHRQQLMAAFKAGLEVNRTDLVGSMDG